MTRSSLCATWVGALAAASAALLFQGGTARAQYSQCENDVDCGPGFVCNEGSYESCSGGVSCDDEGNCVEEPGECQTYEQNWCSSATCETNADCPSYMLCQPQTNWTCEGGMAGTGAGGGTGTAGVGGVGGAGGAACGPEGCEEPVCTEVPAPSLCIQRHFLPCEVASDCGGGFDCVESYYYECNGGAGGAPSMPGGGVGGTGGVGGVGGAAGTGVGGDDGSYECHQVPSGEQYCSLQNLPCESDTECPAGLECKGYYEYPPCEFIPGEGGQGGSAGGVAGTGSAGVGGAGGAAGAVMGGAGGGYEEPGTWVCPEPETTNRCQPLSHLGGGGMGGVGGFGGGPVGGAGGVSGDNGGTAGFGGPGGGAGTGSGSAGMGAGGGSAGEDDGESDEHGHGNGHGRGRGRGLLKKLLSGCSASGPVEGSGSMGWLMLGLAAVVLRRRARRN
jgi:uncharacterized protein (TIGR03382 family)